MAKKGLVRKKQYQQALRNLARQGKCHDASGAPKGFNEIDQRCARMVEGLTAGYKVGR